jgi:hypothetical protein
MPSFTKEEILETMRTQPDAQWKVGTRELTKGGKTGRCCQLDYATLVLFGDHPGMPFYNHRKDLTEALTGEDGYVINHRVSAQLIEANDRAYSKEEAHQNILETLKHSGYVQ